MIERNSIITKIIIGLKLLVLLGLLLYCAKILYVRFMGNKIYLVVEDIQRNGFRSPYSIATVYFNEEKREVYFCPNTIKKGTEIEVYNSDSLGFMFYAHVSKIEIFSHFIVLLLSVIGIYSLLFIKDD